MFNKKKHIKYNTNPVSYRNHSDTVILVLHGYLGSAQTMCFINDILIKNNFNVECPNLRGHGTFYRDLESVRYEDWLIQIETIYNKLRQKFKKVYIVGFSLGGLIALYLAEKYKNINGIILINNILKLPFTLYFASYFKNIIKYVPGMKSDIKDKSSVGEFLYMKISVRNSAEIVKLSKVVIEKIKNCMVPVLIFKSRKDHRTNVKNAVKTFDWISSEKKRIIYLDNSFHVAVLDYDKDIIINEILKFIKAK